MILWRPLTSLISLIVALVTFAGPGTAEKATNDAYLNTLDRSGFFANTAADAIPQTALHDVVLRHFEGPLPAGKTAKKCIVFGFDGARADVLFHSAGQKKSGIQALKADGGLVYQMYTGGKSPNLQLTKTAPGWTSMLTGQWTRGHHVLFNGAMKGVYPLTLFTELVRKDLVRGTGFLVSWKTHFTNLISTYRIEKEYAKWKGYGSRMVWDCQPDDAGTAAATLAMAKDTSAGQADFIFCILEYCDHEGHSSGYGDQNPAYIQAFREADRDAYNILQAIQARPGYAKEDWLILFTSDHGGINRNHGAQYAVERQIYLASNKALF
ncbi:MAG: alkaline phosphatase family protein [Oscillospiraceae bacterium]|nr:alkaline phosphatase family protein [Oscillospiraceae bacterium]